MNKLLLFVLCTCWSVFYAQSDLSLGTKNGREWVSKFLGLHDSKIVGVKVRQNTNRSQKFELLFFDDALNLSKKVEIKFPELDADRIELVNVELIADELVVFYECELRPLNEMKLISVSYGFDGAEKAEFQVVDHAQINKKNKGVYFNLGQSEQKDKMFSYVNHSQWTDSLFLTYTIFNHQRDKLNVDSTMSLTKHKRPVEIMESILDGKGNIHFLCAKGSSASVASNYLDKKYFILSYYSDKKRFQEHQLNLGSYWISDASIFITQDSILSFSGFYSGNRKRLYNGIFQLKMNVNDGSLVYAKFNKFDQMMLGEWGGDEKNKRGLQDFYLEKVLHDSVGGAYLMSEKQYIEVSSYMDPTSRVISYDYYYNFGKVLIFYLSPEGVLMNVSQLDKKQQTINDDGRYSSFVAYLNSDKELNLVYNDHPKNKEAYQQPMDDPKKAVVRKVKFDHNFLDSKEELKVGERQFYLKPQSFYEENGQIYLLFEEDRELVLGRLD